jgi:isoleucyl-tRNA synthetase
MFANIDKDLSTAELEQRVLQQWEAEQTFKTLLDLRKDDPAYIFYEGPPTANGKPGIHHVMARSVKDTVCRYKSMKGFYTERKAGWDTHGLPVEIEVQKKMNLEGKLEIEQYGIEAFNQACRESVFTYKDLWDKMTRQMGYWIDLDKPYITLDNNYIESVWWIIKQFHEADLVYKGHRVVPYCPKCETPLSSHEVAQGYKDVKDPSVYVTMKAVDRHFDFLVWTTTPWTLFSNVAIAVGPDIEYVEVQLAGRERHLLLAKERLSALEGEVSILKSFKGQELLGLRYEPLFTDAKPEGKAYLVVGGDFVSTTGGSGLVHIAPAFGEDDYRVGKENHLAIINTVDQKGCFDAQVPSLKGRFVKDADLDIIMRLKEEGKLYRSQKIEHSYPHCWRCTNPLIYYARESWFIRITEIKDKLIAANKKVNWYPASIGTGRFGAWLENLQDWSLSRDRYWGTPLNVWVCEGCDNTHAIGSQAELRELGHLDKDLELHKPYVDDVVIDCRSCGGKMKRTPEVIDCWFDSGAMPFAQQHYPFENKDNFDKQFPADFISEGIDQTRGWFYSLLAISVFLKGESPYRNVVVGELVLDKNGQKMSKTRGNGVDPFGLMDQYGADVVRWYLLSCTSVWLPTRFDEEGIKAVKRKTFDTLLNTYRFFVMYANVDGFDQKSKRIPLSKRPEMDRWLLARMNTVVKEVTLEYDRYDITKALSILSEFIVEDVSNWYVRLNRRRFWKEGHETDKFAAYCSLQEIMVAVVHLMAPVAPFLSDVIHRELTGNGSVHLSRMPEPDADLENDELESKMMFTRRVVELGRNLRTRYSLKVRQPLRQIIVQSRDAVFTEIVLAELNVKEYHSVDVSENIVKKKSKANFRKLGPIFGKQVPDVAKLLLNLTVEQFDLVQNGKDITIILNGEERAVPADCIEVMIDELEGMVAEGDGRLMVALKTELDQELLDEGFSREFVNRLQNLRKDMNFDITDRIQVDVEGEADPCRVLNCFSESINFELLSTLNTGCHLNGQGVEVVIDQTKLQVLVSKL